MTTSERSNNDGARGDPLRKIAEGLNEAGVPTAQGGGARWCAATIRHVLLRTS
jgi:hypothetical protein